MANIVSSEKDIRKSVKSREVNRQRRSALRTSLKGLLTLIAQGGKEAANAQYRKYVKALDTAARKGLVSKNKASRHKSRLAKKINKLAVA